MDYARFIGIFLVVFGHAMQRFPLFGENLFYDDVWDFIYLFHMPLFFVISGFFYKQIDRHEFINIKYRGGKIWYTLIIPYLLYQILFLPLALIQYKAELNDPNTFFKLMCGIIMGDGYKTPYSLPVNLPCWFIISIIQLRLLFMFVPINKTTSVLSVIGVCTFLELRRHLDWDFYFCLDSTIMAVPYFILGHYLSKTTIIERLKNYGIMLIPLCVILLCLILHFNGAAQMNGPSFGESVLLNYIAGISGTMMIFLLSQLFADKMGKREYIRSISRNTLFIIFAHWVILAPCSIIAYRLPIVLTEKQLWTFLMVALISMCVLYISKLMIDYSINKYPILFGNRKIWK